MRESNAGFSLTELLVTISVVAVLTAMTVPNFSSMLADREARSITYELMSAIRFARSEAVKRNSVVFVSAYGDGWSSGWMVTDSDGTEIRSWMFPTPAINVTESAGLSDLSFNGAGRLPGSASFAICASDAGSSDRRVVRISSSGAPVIELTGKCNA